MRGIVAGVLVFGLACGGGEGTGPTTNHRVTGDWSYSTTLLQDGHSTTCTGLSGGEMNITQSGDGFSGTVLGGLMSCQTAGTPWNLGFGQATVTKGVITRDSVAFNIDNDRWKSFGRFVTEDSMAGVVNGIYPVAGGSTVILTGFWSAKRM